MGYLISYILLAGILIQIVFSLEPKLYFYKHFIKDYVSSLTSPVVITRLFCWNHVDLIEMHQMFPFTMVRTPSRDQFWYNFENSAQLQQNELFILDYSCPDGKNILEMANQNKLFSFPYKWLILHEINEDVTANFIHLDILPDSNIIMAEYTSAHIFLYQIYKASVNNQLIIEPYGNWTINNGIIDNRKSSIISRRRINLQGSKITLSLVITNNDSVNNLDNYKDNHIDTITKIGYKLCNHLMDIVNATKSYTTVPSWGYKDPKAVGGWNGMLGELNRGEADIGTSAFFTADRIPIIDYITMSTPTRTRFVFRAPPLSYVSNLYVLPFGTGVWIALGLLILFMVAALTLTGKCEIERRIGILMSLSDSLLISLGAVCQQGPSENPRNPAGRIVSLFLFVAVMFLYTSYTANIVSLLQARTYSIRTLKDLLHSPLELGAADTVYNRYYFTTATEPIRKAIYEQKIAPKGKKAKFMTLLEGVQKIRKGFFAFQMECGPGYKLMSELFYEDEKCGLIEIDYISVIDPWMPIRKRSPYKEIFKVNMFKIRESGIQSREVALHQTEKPKCAASTASFVSVGLLDCYFGGMLLGIGAAISLILLGAEKICYRELSKFQPKFIETSKTEDDDMIEMDYQLPYLD